MNNKDVMVDSIRKAWELCDKDMCATTFSIAATAGVSLVLSYLTKEQAAHDETKGLLKERMAHQEGLEIRLGNAERARGEAMNHQQTAELYKAAISEKDDVIRELKWRAESLSGEIDPIMVLSSLSGSLQK